MKTIFCANQSKEYHPETDTYKIFCQIYGKECPYTKSSKAIKKCSEIYSITERPVRSEDE